MNNFRPIVDNFDQLNGIWKVPENAGSLSFVSSQCRSNVFSVKVLLASP
jgi:hypothetical protein